MLDALEWPPLEARKKSSLKFFYKIRSGTMSLEKDKYLAPASPSFFFLFVVTAAGVVLCGGPHTSSIVQFIFFGPLRSAEIFWEIRKYHRFRPMYSKQVFAIGTPFGFI